MADTNGNGDVIIEEVIIQEVITSDGVIIDAVILDKEPDTVAPIPVSISIYDGGVALPVAPESDSLEAAGGGMAAVGGAARYGDRLTGRACYTNVKSNYQVTISHNPSSFVAEPLQHITLPIGSGANHASCIEFDIVTRKSSSPQGTQSAYVTLTTDMSGGAGIHASYTITD